MLYQKEIHESKAPSDYTEFICYSVYRLWHHKPSQGSQFIPPKELNTDFINRTQQLLYQVSCWPLLHLALLYIAKLRVALPKTLTSSGSEFKILVAALMLSFKFNSDKNIPNKYWAMWSGLQVQDTSLMEIEFLSSLDCKLFVKSSEYEIWKNSVSVLYQEYLVYKRVQDLQESIGSEETIKSLPRLARPRTWK
jgi:hypothetical protein